MGINIIVLVSIFLKLKLKFKLQLHGCSTNITNSIKQNKVMCIFSARVKDQTKGNQYAGSQIIMASHNFIGYIL